MHVFLRRAGGLAAGFVALSMALAGCVSGPAPEPLADPAHCARGVEPQYAAPTVMAGNQRTDLAGLLAGLRPARVVYVGEIHDHYDHHLHQLTVICGMLADGAPLAIGLEAFQQPFQDVLDAYVAGDIDEEGLLERSEYYDRWRFDFRLYVPIVRLARARGVPLIALNAPAELTRGVARSGLDGLEPGLRALLPEEMAPASEAYRARLARVFAQHPGHAERSFERFVEAQLVWDESMAERAARYLRANPEARMVILAGNGHVQYDQAIPARLRRRLAVADAVVVPATEVTPAEATPPEVSTLPALPRRYALAGAALELSPPGRLGVYLEDAERGVRIIRFTQDSAARDVGLEVGDRIVAVNGRRIAIFRDLLLALWQALPGEQVALQVLRGGTAATEEQLSLALR